MKSSFFELFNQNIVKSIDKCYNLNGDNDEKSIKKSIFCTNMPFSDTIFDNGFV